MKAFYFRFLLFTALILRGGLAWGQAPINDNCVGATQINLINSNYCSKNGEYSNINATTNGLTGPRCFTNGGLDVWFTFIAIATDVRVTVLGKTTIDPGGTLLAPEIGLYSTDDCQNFRDLINCDAGSSGSATVRLGGLIPGERYYVRIQGGRGTTGTFKLCIQNFNPPVDPSADCIKGSILCDKSPFSVSGIEGGGSDPTELNDAECRWTDGRNPIPRNQNAENNTLWYRWTCEKSGPLLFTLVPTRPDLDIDFVIYELPNGVDNCKTKKVVRCMMSGGNDDPRSPCYGATGLRDGENDDSEPVGCDNVPHNNFLRPLNMEAGKSYAIGIDIPYASKEGFSIDWGGTGTFQGPVAKIKINKPNKTYCLGEDVIFDDASTFALGRITNRSWRFGKDASRDTANGVGPFKVFYKTPGWKSVVLTVTTERGCVVTNILDSIYVKPFEYDSLLRRPTCNGGRDGAIRLRVTNCGRAPIRYNWENTGYTTVDSISGLSPGSYRVAVTDSSGLYVDTIRFNLREFVIEIDRARSKQDPPKCNGQTNGRIVVSPLTGVPPFRYRWNNNTFFTLDSTLSGLGNGQYTVEIRDANNCAGFYSFDIQEPPALSVSVDAFNISCFGRIDGYAVAYPSGGVGKYSISWSNGAVGDTVFNLKKGQYVANVVDSNGCFTGVPVTITEPPQIGLTPLSIVPTKCYGDSTGSLVIMGNGGTPPYRYSIDGIRFQRDTVFRNVPGKKYNVVIRDSTGCRETIEVEVPQPPQLQVSAGPDLTVDLGFSIDLRAIVVPSSKLVSYKWTPADSTLSCFDCPQPTARPLRTTIYTVAVQDSAGCTALDDVELKVLKIRPVFIPNVFSPNGDGVNDYFAIFGNQSALSVKELRIYDRWGGQVFEGRELPLNVEPTGWDGTFDGKQLNPDAFTFYAVIRFIDGEEVLYKGSVTLVR
jgi:gliding motility-associated-like protein